MQSTGQLNLMKAEGQHVAVAEMCSAAEGKTQGKVLVTLPNLF